MGIRTPVSLRTTSPALVRLWNGFAGPYIVGALEVLPPALVWVAGSTAVSALGWHISDMVALLLFGVCWLVWDIFLSSRGTHISIGDTAPYFIPLVIILIGGSVALLDLIF